MKSGCVDVFQGHIYYKLSGQGKKTIVWVHGLPLNLNCWYAQELYFSSYFTNLFFDLRGYGKSSNLAPASRNITDLYLADLLALIEAHGLKKIILVGFASGAHMALRFAAKHPQFIDKLVIINGSPCFIKKPDWQWGFDQGTLEEFTEKIQAVQSVQEVSNMIFDRAMQEACVADIKKLRKWFEVMLQQATKKALLGFFTDIAYDDDRYLLRDIVAQTLIINSRLSKEVPAGVGIEMRMQIKNSLLFELNDIDHFAFATHSEIINKIIHQFIEPSCKIIIPKHSGEEDD